MHKLKETIIILTTSIVYSTSMLNVQNAYAWRGVATEFTQYLNFGKLSLQYAKQVQSYITQLNQFQNEIQQYINMVKNTVNLPNEIWAGFAGQVSQIATIYKKSRNIASTLMHADDELKQIYKNYDFYRINKLGVKDYFLQYNSWNKSNSAMYDRMMQLIATQATSFEDENEILRQLLNANKSDTGQKQALQIGNELTAMMIQQMQELRKLIMGQSELQAKVQAQEEAEKARSKAQVEKYFAPLKQESAVIYGDEEGFAPWKDKRYAQ
jgi:P-type conjugative transfer protein TrbJ